MRPPVILSVLAAALALLLVACPAAGTPSGSLEVTIGGLPAEVDGEVTVSGAGGFAQTVTATTTLTDLTPGIYVVTAAPTRSDDPVVSEAYDVTGAPPATVEVTSNATASVSATYAKRPGSGRLWRALSGDPLLDGYSAGQLAASWTPTPAIAIGSDGTSLDAPGGLAFDNSGTLWVDSNGSLTIEAFSPAQLAAGGTPTPEVSITSSNGSDVGGLSFSPPPAELPIHTP